MLEITVTTPIHDSFRVRQIAGMFDLAIEPSSRQTFAAEVPSLDEQWDIGLIVGPSGSGKTTLAKAAFGDAVYQPTSWPDDHAIIDCFGELPIKQITRTLTAVGFSSPPAWLRPYAVLSNGEKFRCELVRALLSSAGARGQGPREGVRGQGPGVRENTKMTQGAHALSSPTSDPSSLAPRSSLTPGPWPLTPPIVFDEFTSVVDRTVARISSAAIAKAIRTGAIPVRFVAVTCHYDVVRWLQPDWVLDMSGPSLSRGRVRRPKVVMRVYRVERSMWNLFKRHHYLTGSMHRSARCYAGFIEGRPAVFTAMLSFPHPIRPGWREHRTVCLPDFQGIGIGTAMSECIAKLYVATGKPYFSTTSHPAMIRHRMNSPLWRMTRKPGMVGRHGPASTGSTAMKATCSRGRNTAGFEYVGPAAG
jgi:hypothetical protein